MDLQEWLVEEFDDTTVRLKVQVLYLVPEERRREQPGGGNSVLWACLHAARHADLALSVLTGDPLVLPAREGRGGGGLEETEQPWSVDLDTTAVDTYLAEVLSVARRYLSDVAIDGLSQIPDSEAGLVNAGVARDTFDWLYQLWRGRPASFFIRWPIIGHLGNHVGEMIATRNRMGLSPF